MPAPVSTEFEPLVGGLDARAERGTSIARDFEFVLNMQGATEEGYSRAMGWRKYLSDGCASGYVNADLHDQMLGAQAVVDITPTVVPVASRPAVPWYSWTVTLVPNALARRLGYLRIRIQYKTGASTVYQAETQVALTGAVSQVLSLDLTGDAHDLKVLRLVGDITGGITETNTVVATGTGSVVETVEPTCVAFPAVERSEITMLRSVTSVHGRRFLFAGTRDALYVNSDTSGNWRMIADGLGARCAFDTFGGHSRIKMETLGDIAVFVTGNEVLSFGLNDQPAGAHLWSADYIADLEALRITSANVVGKYQGFLLIGDTRADGKLSPSRIYWSDYNDARSWVPGGESAAGFHDFGHGEKVLVIESLSGVLRVYTTKAIYDGRIVEDDRIFAFEEIHRSDESSGLPRYPNSIVNDGYNHTWLGADSIYTMNVYDRTPIRHEWLHIAAGIIFRGASAELVKGLPGVTPRAAINKALCNSPVGGYDSVREAMWFSWPSGNSAYNDTTLVIWRRYKKASVVDHGFSAFAEHQPDTTLTLRDWLDAIGACDASTQLLPKEGVACDRGVPAGTFPYLINATNDYRQPRAADSLIASLCNTCLDDLCAKCDNEPRFLMASTGADISIKEYAVECGVRETLTGRRAAPFPVTSIGCYTDSGYTSVLQSRVSRWGTPKPKLLTGLVLNATGRETAVITAQVNASGCSAIADWSDADVRDTCNTALVEVSERRAAGARFSDQLHFQFLQEGEYVSWRIYTSGVGQCFSVGGAAFYVQVNRAIA